MGGFSDVDSQKWGSFSVQKCNFKAKLANFLLKLPQKSLNFSKMRAKRAKMCNFYVKFDTKVEKGGHWV